MIFYNKIVLIMPTLKRELVSEPQLGCESGHLLTQIHMLNDSEEATIVCQHQKCPSCAESKKKSAEIIKINTLTERVKYRAGQFERIARVLGDVVDEMIIQLLHRKKQQIREVFYESFKDKIVKQLYLQKRVPTINKEEVRELMQNLQNMHKIDPVYEQEIYEGFSNQTKDIMALLINTQLDIMREVIKLQSGQIQKPQYQMCRVRFVDPMYLNENDSRNDGEKQQMRQKIIALQSKLDQVHDRMRYEVAMAEERFLPVLRQKDQQLESIQHYMRKHIDQICGQLHYYEGEVERLGKLKQQEVRQAQSKSMQIKQKGYSDGIDHMLKLAEQEKRRVAWLTFINFENVNNVLGSVLDFTNQMQLFIETVRNEMIYAVGKYAITQEYTRSYSSKYTCNYISCYSFLIQGKKLDQKQNVKDFSIQMYDIHRSRPRVCIYDYQGIEQFGRKLGQFENLQKLVLYFNHNLSADQGYMSWVHQLNSLARFRTLEIHYYPEYKQADPNNWTTKLKKDIKVTIMKTHFICK